MTNKEKYRDFCNQTKDLPVFMMNWWMDAVCAGKQWDVLISSDESGAIQAVLPYLLNKRMGMKYILMPQQTQIGGIWLREDVRTDDQRVKEICQVFHQELAQLGICYYYQQYPIDSPVADAMQELGFKTSKRVTYRIEDLTDIEKVEAAFSKNKKRQLQKAATLYVDTQMKVEEFYRFHRQCLRTQGKTINYSREFLLVLERKTARAHQSQFVAIKNGENGIVLAAAYLVWDTRSMYYLIPCYDPLYKDSGASARLVLEAIKIAKEKGLSFDFEGSMDAGIANHYKQFGSKETHYYSVEKYYKWWFRIAMFYHWLREKNKR